MRALMRSRSAAYCVFKSMNGDRGFTAEFICVSGRPALAVVRFDPLAVGTARNRFYPIHVCQIPFHRRAQAAFEALTRLPAELLSYLACVDRITAVVPGPVFHKCDELRVRRARRPELVHDR